MLAAMGRPSMVKGTIVAQGVFLGTTLGGMAEGIVVSTLGVSVGVDHCFDCEVFGEW